MRKKCNCRDILKGSNRGVGVLYVVDYWKKMGGKWANLGSFVLVVKERDGVYRGSFNVVGGKVEGDCWVAEAIREALEEAKVDIRHNFDAEFRDPVSGHTRWIVVNGTPQLVGRAPSDFSRRPLNELIAAANADEALPWCQRETECAEFARLEADGKVRNPEGQELPASDYLVDALVELGKRRANLNL